MFLAMKQNGTAVAAQCSCVAGQGEACNHVSALRFHLENKVRHKDRHLLADTSSTGRLQQWHVPPKRAVQPKCLNEGLSMANKCHQYHHQVSLL